MSRSIAALTFSALALVTLPAFSQSLTFAEVQATGAKALTGAEVRELVLGAKTEFTQVDGFIRHWTNEADGTFIADRNYGPIRSRSGRGTWSVNDDGALCLRFDWGSADTNEWCRQLYRVEDRYYAYAVGAKPETRSGRYRFSR
jgi:hypothetical protein